MFSRGTLPPCGLEGYCYSVPLRWYTSSLSTCYFATKMWFSFMYTLLAKMAGKRILGWRFRADVYCHLCLLVSKITGKKDLMKRCRVGLEGLHHVNSACAASPLWRMLSIFVMKTLRIYCTPSPAPHASFNCNFWVFQWYVVQEFRWK